MNLKQATEIVNVLRSASRPKIDVFGHALTDEKLSQYREPFIGNRIESVDAADSEPESIRISLSVDLQNDLELYIGSDGQLMIWSTYQLPREDCECRCMEASSFGGLVNCPRHGNGIEELDCFRYAKLEWVIQRSQWRFGVVEGDLIRDVLSEYRATKAKYLS